MFSDLEFTTQFLGWCSLINLVALSLSALILTIFKNQIIKLHSQLFGIKEKKLPKLYFKSLAYFKVFVILFNLTPYLALKIMQNY